MRNGRSIQEKNRSEAYPGSWSTTGGRVTTYRNKSTVAVGPRYKSYWSAIGTLQAEVLFFVFHINHPHLIYSNYMGVRSYSMV